MTEIKMISWKEGMQKVSLTKLQTEVLYLTLKEAKNNVDSLLDGQEVCITAPSLEQALSFIEKAEKIGAICKVNLE